MTCAAAGEAEHGEARAEERALAKEREVDHRPVLHELD